MNATSGENNLVIKANFSVPRLKYSKVSTDENVKSWITFIGLTLTK